MTLKRPMARSAGTGLVPTLPRLAAEPQGSRQCWGGCVQLQEKSPVLPWAPSSLLLSDKKAPLLSNRTQSPAVSQRVTSLRSSSSPYPPASALKCGVSQTVQPPPEHRQPGTHTKPDKPGTCPGSLVSQRFQSSMRAVWLPPSSWVYSCPLQECSVS